MKNNKTLSVLYYLLIIPLFLLILLFVGAALPGFGGYKIMTVLSGSMEPAIKEGSVVVVMEAERYLTGDVVTFKKRGVDVPTTHRIEDVRLDGGDVVYITKGDANPVADISEVSEEEIIGKTLFSIPLLGYLVEFTKKPVGFLLLVVLPMMIIIFGEIIKIYKELKSKKGDQR